MRLIIELVFTLRQCHLVTIEQDRSGRVLRYDPQTQQTTVIARDVFYPNGVAVSQDSSFLLLSYTSKSRYYPLVTAPKNSKLLPLPLLFSQCL